MKRAFLFSVIFILLFTIFLLLSVFYLNILQMNELNLAETRNITRLVYTEDDITTDLLDYLELSVNVESNSTHTILNISDSLISPYANPVSMLNEYKSFINGTYSNQTNLLDPSTNLSIISLNTTGFENSPSLQFINSNSSLNLRYGYNNLSKNELIINGSSLLRDYSLTMVLNNTCLNNNCTNATLAGGTPIIDSSTVGMWHFDEGSGTTVADSSGNNNTGSLYNTPAWVGGRFNSSLQFTTDEQDHIIVNDSSSLDINGSLTVEMWFKPALLMMSNEWLLHKGNTTDATASNYEIWIDAPYHLRGRIGNSTDSQDVTSSIVIQPDTWYHMAFTADGTNLSLYINGILDNFTAQNFTPVPNDQQLIIGGRGLMASFHFNGTIDEVAIYSRAKSADEIAADANLFHWDWGTIAINSNISAAWHFDEGSGNTTYDSSGNGNIMVFNATQTATLSPSSTHKAYSVNSTSADDPFLATTEMNYSKITVSDDVRDNSSASYSNTFTRNCQAGTCSCKGSSSYCWSQSLCINSTGCTASCPSTGNATNTSYSCSLWITGCVQGCDDCISP